MISGYSFNVHLTIENGAVTKAIPLNQSRPSENDVNEMASILVGPLSGRPMVRIHARESGIYFLSFSSANTPEEAISRERRLAGVEDTPAPQRTTAVDPAPSSIFDSFFSSDDEEEDDYDDDDDDDDYGDYSYRPGPTPGGTSKVYVSGVMKYNELSPSVVRELVEMFERGEIR